MLNLSERQKEIINLSIKIIAERGIQQLTIKNISQGLGVSEPAIYRHFESKMDILMAILANFKNSASQTIDQLHNNELSAFQKIKMLFELHFEKFVTNPALAAVIFSEEIFQNDKRLSILVSEIMNLHIGEITCLIIEGQQTGEIRNDIPEEQLSLIIVGSLRLIVTRWRLSDFSFDLKKEGSLLWHSLGNLIKM